MRFNKLLFFTLLLFAGALSACNPAYAQSNTNRIYRNCPSTTTKASVALDVAGNITITPCSGGTVTSTGVFSPTTININNTGPATPSAGINLGTLISGSGFTWKNSAGFTSAFSTSGQTASRTFTLPDASVSLVGTTSITTNTLTKGAAGNTVANSQITDDGTTVNIAGAAGKTVNIGGVDASGLISSGVTTFLGDVTGAGNITRVTINDTTQSTTVTGLIPTNHVISLASPYTNATATFSNTALSRNLVAGKTYAFTIQLFISDSTAADGFQVDLAGGSATATTFVAGTNSTLTTATTSTLAGTFSNSTLTGTNMVTINGTIIVNAAGTFIVRAAQNAHTTGTLTIGTGSSLILTRLN